MSNEKDAIRIDPAAQQFAEMLVSLFEPAIKIMTDAKAMAGQSAPDNNIVNMSMTREAFEKQRADLAEVDQLRKQVEALKSQLHVAETRLQATQAEIASEQRNAAKAINANRLYGQQIASLQGQLRAAGSHATHAEYNKLWKQHTACKNQRDSYAATIATKDKVIAELNTTITNLKKQPQTPCAVLLIDSIPYTPDEVRKIVAVSADRAREIEQLTRDLTTMTSLRDSAVKTSEDLNSQVGHYRKLYEDTVKLNTRLRADCETLTAGNEDLRSRIKVFYFNGHPISDERVKQLCDLGAAAEEAGFTTDSIKGAPAKAIVTQQDDAGQSAAAYEHLGGVKGGKDTIVVWDPDKVQLQLHIDGHRVLNVEASIIPQLVLDVQSARNRADHLESDLGKCMERNNQQAVSLRAAEREMATLRENVSTLKKRVSDKDADIQRLTIERNLVRSQLNELRALKTPATVNGQVLQAGEAYMTTALGMLPINSEGMRKLSDTLDTYRAKVASLTKGLQEWIKT